MAEMTSFKGRREDYRLVRGEGRYTGDWRLDDQLHAAFVRATHAHALIRGISTEAAMAAPGVVAILTGRDVADAGFGTVTPSMPFPGRNGFKILHPQRPLLARDQVRFVGEEVAIVVAETRGQAMDAADLIEVDYEEAPVVIGFDRALAPGAPLVHDAIAGNVCFDYEYGDAAAVDAAMARAHHVTRLELDSPRVAPNPMEPRSVLAWFDTDRQTYEIRCSNQGANEMRGGLSAMLGVRPDQIRVHRVDVGGAFGPRGAPYPEYAILLHAARRLGRPIKWDSTRSEDFQVDSHGRAIRLKGELALDEKGNFLALRTLWLCDEGAYLTGSGALTNCGNGHAAAAGPYKTPAMYGRHRLVMTNTNPTAPYRGAGRPEAAYIIERLVDQAAVDLGRDPFELRLQNVLAREQMPYKSPSGSEFDSGDFARLLTTAQEQSGWASFAARRAASEAAGKLRGIGCALFLEPSGGGSAPKDEVALRIGADGMINIYLAPTSSGQGHETVFPEMVAARLGIDDKRIQLQGQDPDGVLMVGSGAFGSRSTMVQGSVLQRAADEMIFKGIALAADLLETDPADIEFNGGKYVIKGTDRSVDIVEVIEKRRGAGPHPLDTIAEMTIGRAFPSSAHVAELEIDPYTGIVKVASYTAVEDIGHIVNYTLAEGQLQGGILQGAGQAFGERCVYDEASGQLLSGSFMDYFMPHADTMPGVRMFARSVPSPNNLLGSKGVGEAGTVGAAPTLMNAVLDALRSAGVTALDMPASPDRVWAALDQAPRKLAAE